MKKKCTRLTAVLLTAVLCLSVFAVPAGAVRNFYLRGDMNNDGKISTDDARIALRYAVYLENDSDIIALCGDEYEYLYAMDMNRDNELGVADARLILRAAVGLDSVDTLPYSYNKADVDAICSKYGAYGVQAAVIRNGKVISTYNYGVADKSTGRKIADNTKFRVASLSKLVTFATCMALVDRGYLDINTDISKYLGFTVRNPYSAYSDIPITLRMLMAHCSSIIDGGSFYDSMDGGSSYSLKYLLSGYDNFMNARPGTRTEYSNFAAALVGSICELVTGRPFESLAQEYVIDPLGLDTGFVASSLQDKTFAYLYEGGYLAYGPNGYNNSKFNSTLGQTVHMVQGALKITASDYAKVLCMLLNGGLAPDGKRVLSQASVNEMLCDQYVDEAETIGFATYIIRSLYPGMTHYTHTGSAYGFHGAYAMDKDYRNGVVIFSSGCARSLDEDTAIYNICQAIIYELMPEFE